MNQIQSYYFYLIPFFLALGYFSSTLSNSRGGEKLKAGIPMKVSLLFSIMGFLMILAGSFLSGMFSAYLVGAEILTVLVFLVFLSVRLIISGWLNRPSKRVFDIESMPIAAGMSVALGVNALFAGVAIRYMGLPVLKVAGVYAILVWFISFGGLLNGNSFSENFGRITDILAGTGLLIITLVYYFTL
jgi:putative Mn2+ efflux pump MntP